MLGSAAVWVTVIALGAFHGANPSMGWLFAVSNGLFERRARAVFTALPPIALGHLLAMALVLLPLAALAAFGSALPYIRAIAGAAIITFGVYRLFVRRHPRVLARIGASNLTLWSFVMATAHGAALMLVPVYLGAAATASMAMPGMHGGPTAGQANTIPSQSAYAGRDMALAGAVALVHTMAMLAVAAAIAWLFYRFFGLTLLRQVWFNVDIVWAVALIIAGIITIV